MKINTSLTAIATLTLGLLSSPIQAVQQGDWFVRIGASSVSAHDSSTGFSAVPTVGAAVESNAQPSINLTYMLQNSIGIELLAAAPFSHDITATGAGAALGKVAETKQLPPTLSLQYHFRPQTKIRPYAGIGINFTNFFDINTTDASNTLTSLDLEDSWGMAAQVGVDYDIGNDWFVNLDLRYINIETTGTSNLGNIDVEIDPTVLTVAAGFNF